MKKLSPADYAKEFGINARDKSKLKSALKHALDIRKFEIQLYWIRTAYFWTIIAAALAGYFAIQAAEHLNEEKRQFLSFVISCLGFVFSFSWYCVNRGSKYWQENWENHVDILEDKINGPLYKTVMSRPYRADDDVIIKLEALLTGPGAFSVSKINQLISIFTTLTWTYLGFLSLPPFSCAASVSVKHMVLFSITLVLTTLIYWKGRTHGNDYSHDAFKRDTYITN
jgi:hypothetical protein